MKKIVFLLGCMAFCLMACEKNTLDIPKRQPMVKINSITAHSANISVSLEETGGNSDPYHAPHSTVDSVVLVLADNVSMANPTIYKKQPERVREYSYDYKSVSFSTTSLSSNKTYYCYALITNSAFSSPIQSEITSFTTREVVAPKITTDKVEVVNCMTIKAYGNLKEKGSGSVKEIGFYCVKDGAISGVYANASSTKVGSFSCEIITELVPNTKYYIQAYCQTEDTTVYGEKVYCTTPSFEFETAVAVDLGLSVKWANMNVGANAPEEYGDYFAWGETSPKATYNWSTYKYCKGSSYTMTKYCTSSSYGTVDNKTTLEPTDDAARVNWGVNWRLPTTAEQDELRNTDNCTWEWKTNYNGTNVNGYLVTSKKNGNTIFLPASGYRDGSSLTSVGSHGYYWCSSLYSIEYLAYCLYFYSGHVNWSSRNRYYGQSVRPVCQ